MASAHTESDAVRICAELLGVTAITVKTKRAGVTYLTETTEGRVVVKFGRPSGRSSPLVEAWAYGQCQRLGLRAPAVLATQTEPECLITSALPGRSLWKQPASADHASAWAAAGADLRALHEIRVAGFGPLYLKPAGEDPRGVAPSWAPFLDDAVRRGLPYLADHDVIPVATATTLVRRLSDVAADVSGFAEARLLHGDLEGGHIFVDDDRYVGMIDFDQAQAGDPRWDLARVTLWDGEQALDWMLAGYGSDAVTPEERVGLLPVYLMACVVHHTVQAHEEGRDDAVRELLQMSRFERLL